MLELTEVAMWGLIFSIAWKGALIYGIVEVFRLRKRVDALERELRPTAVRDVEKARASGGRASNVPWDIGR
jgi:hypothetical protein